MSEKTSVKASYGPYLLLSSLVLFFLGGLMIWSQANMDFSNLSRSDLEFLAQQINAQLHNKLVVEGLERRDKNPLDITGVRVVIGIGVFAVINVVVITVHHIVQKVSRSSNLYRSMEHVMSPF